MDVIVLGHSLRVRESLIKTIGFLWEFFQNTCRHWSRWIRSYVYQNTFNFNIVKYLCFCPCMCMKFEIRPKMISKKNSVILPFQFFVNLILEVHTLHFSSHFRISRIFIIDENMFERKIEQFYYVLCVCVYCTMPIKQEDYKE